MSADDFIVRLEHVYSVPNFNGQVGFCGRGCRAWFARYHLDWAAFVRDGLPASQLLATGDAMAQRVVEHARSAQRG